MVRGTVQERSFDLLPEDWYTAKLVAVSSKQVGDYMKLKWKWEIVEGDSQGKNAWGECFQRLDQSDSCTWRRWQEALVERPIAIDEEVDTDDVVGYMAQICVRHRSYEARGTQEVKWTAEIPDNPVAVQPVAATELPEIEYGGGPDGVPVGATAANDPWAQPPAGQPEEPPF